MAEDLFEKLTHQDILKIRNAPKKDLLAFMMDAPPGQIEQVVDAGLRHKSGAKPYEYLLHWLKIARCFGYATQDDSWGEFEKEFAIIIKRLVVAERALKSLGLEDVDDDI